jgi:molybdate transport system substrate-binding protein
MTNTAFRRLRSLGVMLLVGAAFSASTAWAEEARIAVAANFTAAAKEIATAFGAQTGHEAELIFASTGKLYTQIANGAPFDVFLAADTARPEKAEAEGLAVPGTRFTYAVGQIVLFSADPTLVDSNGEVLKTGDFAKLANANPKTAPYGAAGVEAMTALGIYELLAPRIVTGDNVSQTLQFITTQNAALGFVALSQVIDDESGSKWMVPADLYTPIRQDAVLLNPGANNEAATEFLAFLKSEAARDIIAGYGYGTD